MKIHILPEVHRQIMYYVNNTELEISGVGRIMKADNGDMLVTKAYLLDQENGPATTDIDEEALAKLMYETREDEGDLNFWWHSHVEMECFWSGTDMDTIEQFGKNGYLLATVFNQKGDHRSAYFQGAGDFLPKVFVDKIDTSFMYVPTGKEMNGWAKEIKEKCRVHKPIPFQHNHPAGGLASGHSYSGYKMADYHDPHYYYDGENTPKGKNTAPLSHISYLEIAEEMASIAAFGIELYDLPFDSIYKIHDAYNLIHKTEEADRSLIEAWYSSLLGDPQALELVCDYLILEHDDGEQQELPIEPLPKPVKKKVGRPKGTTNKKLNNRKLRAASSGRR